MSLDQDVKKWVETDTLIKIHLEKIRQLREQKQSMENNILKTVSKYDKKPIINITDGTLKFCKVNVQQPLSYKLIQTSLEKTLNSEREVECIMNAIRNERGNRECDVIKRYYR